MTPIDRRGTGKLMTATDEITRGKGGGVRRRRALVFAPGRIFIAGF
jgi:hypothetical protein